MADFRFNVSDAYFVPLRGWMLRLKLTGGTFQPSMLKPGSSFRLLGPAGEERTAVVKGWASTAGNQKKDRVETYKEFDVVIDSEHAVVDGREVDIGWTAAPA